MQWHRTKLPGFSGIAHSFPMSLVQRRGCSAFRLFWLSLCTWSSLSVLSVPFAVLSSVFWMTASSVLPNVKARDRARGCLGAADCYCQLQPSAIPGAWSASWPVFAGIQPGQS